MTESLEDFLAHYGVKGMRWGVRKKEETGGRDRPGILDENGNPRNTLVAPGAMKREAKAKKIEEQAAVFQKRAAEFRATANAAPRASTKSAYESVAKENERLADLKLEDAKKIREGKMTDAQKKALIGAAVVGTALLAYGAYNMKQSGEFHRLSKKGKAFMNGDKNLTFKRKESLANQDFSHDDIMKKVIPGINKDYGKWGTNMNCRRCTFAYELRRRGFDVEATKTSNASGQNAIGLMNALTPDKKFKRTGTSSAIIEFTKGGKEIKEFTANMEFPVGGKVKIAGNTAKDILGRLGQEPDGSRGEFGVTWRSAMPGIPGGGHSMAYEIIKGKVHIFDGQTGESYSSGHEIFDRIQDAGFTRLDNVDLNMDYLARWVKDRG